MEKHIIELEEGVFLSPWSGDPGRTISKDNAKKFTKSEVEKALSEIRRDYPDKFINAKII